MRLQYINTTTFQYRAYLGKTEVLSNGRHTGHSEPSYADPVEYRGNISVPYGQASQQMFGQDIRYTHVLVMEDPNADIKEDGLIDWRDNTYEIKAVRPSLNYLNVALKRRTKNSASED